MNCFNHPDSPAVGICKYCQRGLCKDCAIDSGCGIACKYHQENVRTLTNIQIDSKRTLQNTEMLVREIPAFFIGFFLTLLGRFTDNSIGTVIGMVGLGLMIIISVFVRMKNYQYK